jgi:transaldolase
VSVGSTSRRPEPGLPDLHEEQFPGPDLSWPDERIEFTSAIREGRDSLGDGTGATSKPTGVPAAARCLSIADTTNPGRTSRRRDDAQRSCGMDSQSGGQNSERGMTTLTVHTKLFADCAELSSMLQLAALPYISGFTTNPTLMNKAGVRDYRMFAEQVLNAIPDRPISFEVFSDEFDEMERQALEIASWGNNVYVKIPVTNTRSEPALNLIESLSRQSVKLNVTAVMTLKQVAEVAAHLRPDVPSCVSVFAGRIADTGRDPVPIMTAAVELLRVLPAAELIWASPRELLNIFQADAIGCHIITVTPDILNKLALVGRDLTEYSLETVRMFYKDALAAGFSLDSTESPVRIATGQRSRHTRGD